MNCGIAHGHALNLDTPHSTNNNKQHEALMSRPGHRLEPILGLILAYPAKNKCFFGFLPLLNRRIINPDWKIKFYVSELRKAFVVIPAQNPQCVAGKTFSFVGYISSINISTHGYGS